MDQLCEAIRKQVLERMDFTKEFPDAQLQELIAREMSYQKDVESLSIQQRVFVEQRVFAFFFWGNSRLQTMVE